MTAAVREPKISVCMATRNGERFLPEQLRSILSQLAPGDEVVISDDSSQDGTAGVIRGFADPRICLLEGNRFFSPIFNFENALKNATGDIIVLSDQDDLWLEGKIALIRERFRLAASPLHLVVLDGEAIDEEGRVIEESLFRKLGAGTGLLKNVYDNSYMGCCMAFSRELLEIALPFPRRIPMHDMWLGLLAELFGTVEFVPEKTIRYRKHGSSVTQFGRRFMPVIQLKRRVFLSSALVTRWLEVKRRGALHGRG